MATGRIVWESVEAEDSATAIQPATPPGGKSRGTVARAALLAFPKPQATDHRDAAMPMVGRSPAMRNVRELIGRLGPKDITVLVSGETGTGKEVVATALHAASRRASSALVRVNCAAIPRDLVEPELFGHTRGAFTGAVQGRAGLFAAANHGTILLDEVESLPLEAQAKLLRAVQLGEVQTVGTDSVRRVDVRLIACTNTDLAADVREGRFRRDLYYRLAVVRVALPPLRERREDIADLVAHFVAVHSVRLGVGPIRYADGLIDRMQSLEWEGNVRELENTVVSMIALSEDGQLDESLLPNATCDNEPGSAAHGGLRSRVLAYERSQLQNALTSSGNNRSEAARRLGLSRTTFLGLIKRHELDGSQPRRG